MITTELKSHFLRLYQMAFSDDNFDVLEMQMLYKFAELENAGLAELTILDGVGVERFAYHAWKQANELVQEMTNGRCRCVKVECAEHGANSAIYKVDQ